MQSTRPIEQVNNVDAAYISQTITLSQCRQLAMLKLHYFDFLWVCSTTYCTRNPQHIEPIEFEPNKLYRLLNNIHVVIIYYYYYYYYYYYFTLSKYNPEG